jgi:uncharacterized membrane protein
MFSSYQIISLFLAFLPLAISAYFFLALRVTSALLFVPPAASIATFLLFARKRKAPAEATKYLRKLELLFLLVLLFAESQVVSTVLGTERKPAGLLVVFSCSLAYLGWAINRVPRNRALGIRFPWIMKSEKSWKKTQEFGSLGLYFSAIFPPLAALLPPSLALPVTIVPLLLAMIATLLYSLKFKS